MFFLFSPEDFSAEHLRIADVARSFVRDEVHPRSDDIDSGNFALVKSLLRRAGGLGLLAPGNSLVSQAIVAENVGPEGSFSVAVIGHSGIGTLPIYMYGGDGLRARYIPRMAKGEIVSAFALTEKNTGSDALSVETTAVPSADGSFTLNGEKIYCSNGNIADVFVVFAKIEGRGLTAFIVERDACGLGIGDAPQKMGLGGSAAVPLTFSNVRVPAENVIGEQGGGQRVALNVLNIGRLKLGATCIGNSKGLVSEMIRVATTRRRFGRPIADFELIRQKIARAACRVYMHESLVYRLAGDMDRDLASRAYFKTPSPPVGEGGGEGETCCSYHPPLSPLPSREGIIGLEMGSSNLAAVSEKYAMECAIAKVYGSETIAFVSDEAVQLLGGEGYVRGSAAERAYRDFRVDRIFEGTNEINRLFIASSAIKMAMSDRRPSWFDASGVDDPLIMQIDNLKSVAFDVATAAVKNLGDSLKRRQAVLANISDMLIEIYALESGVARAIDSGNRHFKLMCEASIAEGAPALHNTARQTAFNINGRAIDTLPFVRGGIGWGRSTSPVPSLQRRGIDEERLIAHEPLAVDTDSIYGDIARAVLGRELWPKSISQ